MFTGKQLRRLLIPLMIETVLLTLMGTVDTMMVSTVGSTAISAVALVDSINVLFVNIFSALATGGTIVCSQYLGRQDRKEATENGKQLIMTVLIISVSVTLILLILRKPLLRVIFGKVETEIMERSQTYFLITAMSYPFIAVYNAGAALFRVDGHSRLPMVISTTSNVLNIACNALLIFGMGMGVAGAAIATLLSRIFSAVVVMCFLRRDDQAIVLRNYLSMRPDFKRMRSILAMGIPAGIENGMFQFGKLVLQSTLSTLPTASIAAHSMAAVLELLSGQAAWGIGMGLITVAGQAIGANRIDLARKYIKQLTIYAEITVIVMNIIIAVAVRPITVIGKMESEAAELCCRMVYAIAIYKCIPWTMAFVPANGLRAAGDVRFTMTASTLTMWFCRVAFTIIAIRVFKMGAMFMWYGMFLDWTARAIVFAVRLRGDKWHAHRVIGQEK